jgi:hypothetical protein
VGQTAAKVVRGIRDWILTAVVGIWGSGLPPQLLAGSSSVVAVRMGGKAIFDGLGRCECLDGGYQADHQWSPVGWAGVVFEDGADW